MIYDVFPDEYVNYAVRFWKGTELIVKQDGWTLSTFSTWSLVISTYCFHAASNGFVQEKKNP